MNRDEHQQFDEFERRKLLNTIHEHIRHEIDGRIDAALNETLREMGAMSQPPGSNGRWNELTVEDFKFLHSCGISVNCEEE